MRSLITYPGGIGAWNDRHGECMADRTASFAYNVLSQDLSTTVFRIGRAWLKLRELWV